LGKPVYKLLIFMKRRHDTSPQQFREYYERTHSKLGERIGREVGVCYYARRYLHSLTESEFDYDVLTEVWWEDRSKFETVAGRVSRGVLPAGVAEDEERFLDRSKTRFVTVEECESPG